MRAIALATVAAVVWSLAAGNCNALADDAAALRSLSPAAQPTELTSRARKRRRPRIRVFPREGNSLYPRTTPYAWPGPGAVRLCRAWLVQEFRPDGVFVVPRQRCWWERG